jgi:hypothetical protein
MSLLAQVACRTHPARAGIGICPACATTICEECSTRVDGVLHCRTCLEGRRAPARYGGWRSLPAVLPALVLVPAATLAVAGGLYGMAWLLTAAGSLERWLQRLH